MKLLIIADDFTGAMDTGVQFAASGTPTQVLAAPTYQIARADTAAQVLVLDTETRHLSPSDAYAAVYGVVQQAIAAGIPYIYKKTDSALRGNIGSELTAVVDASHCQRLPFIPAFPQVGRVTRQGVHYINNVPVAESVFGRDPFNPVKHSAVDVIIRQQSSLPVLLCAGGDPPAPGGDSSPSILVFDGETDDDLMRIGRSFGPEGPHISAGCAGFASVLSRLLNLRGKRSAPPPLPPRLLVVCGSVNPITIRQLEAAEAAGFPRFHLTPEQKLDPLWLEGEGCSQMVRRCLRALEQEGVCILDSNDPGHSGETARTAGWYDLTPRQVRTRISTVLGGLLRRCLDEEPDVTLMCIGGDTLLGLMQSIGVGILDPIDEISPGVVLAEFVYHGKRRPIISKSGGFGEPELLCSLSAYLGIKGKENRRDVHAHPISAENTPDGVQRDRFPGKDPRSAGPGKGKALSTLY